MTTSNYSPIDYLVIGHITQDLSEDHSWRLGGTVSYAGLTAAALGLRVGILTSCSPDINLEYHAPIQLYRLPSTATTSFRNLQTKSGRRQYLFHPAQRITLTDVPEAWRTTPIVHLGPVANEIDPQIYEAFPHSFMGITPQGWLRQVDEQGRVSPRKWPFCPELLTAANAVVLSIEDLDNDENEVETMAEKCAILVVTEGDQGARVYWNGDVRRFPAPQVPLVEDTGAGDIFAACFFYRLDATHDPWEATRFAVELAALSVTRTHFASIPTEQEIRQAQMQVV